MDFNTVIFIISMNLIVFGFIAWSVKSRNDLKREELRAGGGSNSLGTSELKGLIQEAMEDAVSPLEERMEKMEASLRQLPAPSEKENSDGF